MISRLGERVARGLRDLPLRNKGLIVVVIPLLGLLVFSFAFYLIQRESRQADRAVRQTLQILSELQTAHIRIQEAETAARAYLLTDRDDWLALLQRSRAELPVILARLKGMVDDNPVQYERVGRIETLATQRLSRLTASAGLRQNDDNVWSVLDNKSEVDAIRQELAAASQEEDRLLHERMEHERTVWQQSSSLIAAALIFAPAGAVLAMLLFTMGIAERLRRVEENAQRLAAGIPLRDAGAAKDEIGRLERSMNEAGALLSLRERELRDTRDELETRVEQRTAELGQTNTALEQEIRMRGRTQEDLREANERLRAVIQAAPLAIIRLDLDGIVRGWNAAAEEMFGWTEQEVLGQPVRVAPGEDFEDLATTPVNGDSPAGAEKRRRRKDGSAVETRVWTAPLHDRHGEWSGRIAVLVDFSDRRRLEEQFAQAQKMEAVGRLAGGVAHDFNNLITVIAGYSQMVLEQVKHDETLTDFTQEVLKASNRAASLAGQLLTFSRRQAIQPTVLDLNALVGNVEKMLRRVIGEDIELTTSLSPNIGLIKADSGQIEQVIMNLAVNARDAMPGGGRLTIETTQVELDEEYCKVHAGSCPGRHVMLAISDTGHGMDAETKRHLFEPFFTTKERGRGTGLGLSTVYGIVKQHGGDIWVYSERGHGTTFKIYLPQAAAAQEAEPSPAAAQQAPYGSETILVVEDEDGVRRLLRSVLEQHGYTILEAQDGPTALALDQLFPGRIDMLLTDIVMPGMSGQELAMKFTAARPDVKVLFLSGYTDTVIHAHGMLAPDAAFLQKPFTPASLTQKIREVLDRTSVDGTQWAGSPAD